MSHCYGGHDMTIVFFFPPNMYCPGTFCTSNSTMLTNTDDDGRTFMSVQMSVAGDIQMKHRANYIKINCKLCAAIHKTIRFRIGNTICLSFLKKI